MLLLQYLSSAVLCEAVLFATGRCPDTCLTPSIPLQNWSSTELPEWPSCALFELQSCDVTHSCPAPFPLPSSGQPGGALAPWLRVTDLQSCSFRRAQLPLLDWACLGGSLLPMQCTMDQHRQAVLQPHSFCMPRRTGPSLAAHLYQCSA